MAATLFFELVSPDRLLMSAEVAQVTVPGTEGEFGVLPGHAPLISTTRHGVVRIYEKEKSAPVRIFIRGGFADVTPTGLTLLAEEAVPLAEVDPAALAQQIQEAREDVADARDENRRAEAETKLQRLKELQGALADA